MNNAETESKIKNKKNKRRSPRAKCGRKPEHSINLVKLKSIKLAKTIDNAFT